MSSQDIAIALANDIEALREFAASHHAKVSDRRRGHAVAGDAVWGHNSGNSTNNRKRWFVSTCSGGFGGGAIVVDDETARIIIVRVYGEYGSDNTTWNGKHSNNWNRARERRIAWNAEYDRYMEEVGR